MSGSDELFTLKHNKKVDDLLHKPILDNIQADELLAKRVIVRNVRKYGLTYEKAHKIYKGTDKK